MSFFDIFQNKYPAINKNLVINIECALKILDTIGEVSKQSKGFVPQLPNETTTIKYLRQDGTWKAPPTDNATGGTADYLWNQTDRGAGKIRNQWDGSFYRFYGDFNGENTRTIAVGYADNAGSASTATHHLGRYEQDDYVLYAPKESDTVQRIRDNGGRSVKVDRADYADKISLQNKGSLLLSGFSTESNKNIFNTGITFDFTGTALLLPYFNPTVNQSIVEIRKNTGVSNGIITAFRRVYINSVECWKSEQTLVYSSSNDILCHFFNLTAGDYYFRVFNF
jgi:hypothetical protein